MNNNSTIEKLRSLRKLQPKPEVVSTVELRVFAVVNGGGEVSPQPVRSPYVMHLRKHQLLGTFVAFCLVLVFTNQVSRHSAYEYSISSLAETQRLTESFEQNGTKISEVNDSLSHTREAYNSLSLDGALGLYTLEQCRSAYILYDGYLDYTLQTIDSKLEETNDATQMQELSTLKETLTVYRKEAQERIKMYP